MILGAFLGPRARQGGAAESDIACYQGKLRGRGPPCASSREIILEARQDELLIPAMSCAPMAEVDVR